MDEEWLMPGAIVPVDTETTQALVNEVKRMIAMIGDMTLSQQKEWVGLTDEDRSQIAKKAYNKAELTAWELAQRVGEFTEAKLREKNGD
jgi:hypothetical protein